MEKKLLREVNLKLLAEKNNGVVPDIPPKSAAKELKRFIKSRKGEEAMLTLELSGNYCFIGSRPVTDDPSRLRVYYLGPEGLRKTPPIDLQTFTEGLFKPDFQNDQRAKRKHVVAAFMNSTDGSHQARDLMPTLTKRLNFIAASQKSAKQATEISLPAQIVA